MCTVGNLALVYLYCTQRTHIWPYIALCFKTWYLVRSDCISVLRLGGEQEEERVVLELGLVDPLRLNLSIPRPGGKARQKYICDVCQ